MNVLQCRGVSGSALVTVWSVYCDVSELGLLAEGLLNIAVVACGLVQRDCPHLGGCISAESSDQPNKMTMSAHWPLQIRMSESKPFHVEGLEPLKMKVLGAIAS